MKKGIQLSIFLTSLFIGQAQAQSFNNFSNFNNNGYNNGCYTGYEAACMYQNNNMMTMMPQQGGSRNFQWGGNMPLNFYGQRNNYNNRYNNAYNNNGRYNNNYNNNNYYGNNNNYNNNSNYNNFYNNQYNPFFNGRPY